MKKLYNHCTMEKYRHTREFQIKYREADFKDELKVSGALGYMEEVASSSADEIGLGYQDIQPKGYAFIISNTYCEILRPMHEGEKLFVQTWPSIPSFVVFERQYRFLDENHQPTLNAVSRWCLMDVKTGKVLPSKVIDNQDYSTYNTEKTVEGIQWKIPTFSTEGKEPKFTITIANSEYDHNMHVNNTRYADYCMNVFSVAELQGKSVSKFSISYAKQCREGETLRFFREETELGEYLVQGKNVKEETVVLAKIVFAK